jgi:hypothetical protein
LRYYDLKISDPTTGEIWKPAPAGLGFIKSVGGSTFTSFSKGQTDPGAVDIEFDIPVTPYSDPQGQAGIKIHGVGLKMLAPAAAQLPPLVAGSNSSTLDAVNRRRSASS